MAINNWLGRTTWAFIRRSPHLVWLFIKTGSDGKLISKLMCKRVLLLCFITLQCFCLVFLHVIVSDLSLSVLFSKLKCLFYYHILWSAVITRSRPCQDCDQALAAGTNRWAAISNFSVAFLLHEPLRGCESQSSPLLIFSLACECRVCRWDIEARLKEKVERNWFCMNVKYIHFSTGVTRKLGSSHVRALTYKLTWKVLIKHGRRDTWRTFKAICVFKWKERGWKLYRKKRLTN